MKTRLSGILTMTVLFLLGLILYLYFTLVVNRNLFWGDENAFTIAGYFWFRGITTAQEPAFFVEGWTLQRTSDSPPLSKLITGTFIHLLSLLGVSRYPIPIRLHCSILLSGTGVVCYSIGRKLGSEKTGLLTWFLVASQPILQPEGPYLLLSSLDITCIFFSSICAYFLLEDKARNLLISGIFFGLASLSKYVAIMMIPPFVLTWTLQSNDKITEALKKTMTVTIVGLCLHVAFNPMITVPLLRETMINWQIREGNVYFQWSADKILMLQALMGKAPLDIALTRFILKMFFLPIQLTGGYYLVFLALIAIYYAGYKRMPLSRKELFPFLWFVFTFLFLELHWKHHYYYKLLLFPSLAVFNSVFWTSRIRVGNSFLPQSTVRND